MMGNPKPRFYLALAFLVWSLVPHFRLVVHTHAVPEGGHAHATFTPDELRLADQALQSLPSADPGEFGGETSGAAGDLSGEPAWTLSEGEGSHAHLQQDANSVTGPLPEGGPAARAPPQPRPASPYRAPVLPSHADRPARGPPASLLA